MVVKEKESIFIISLAGLSTFLFILLTFGFGVTAEKAFASFSLIGFIGLLPVFRRRSKEIVDERDMKIAEKAARAGFGIFWLMLTACAVIVYYWMGPDGSIPVIWATNTIIAGMVIILTARAIVQLVLYRMSVK